MKKEQILNVFFYRLQHIKRFLTSKDLFIFLFFLGISTAIWGLHALRKTYETVIQIPVTYENTPLGFAQTEKLPDILKITISDRGSALFNYRVTKRFSPVSVDLEEYLNGNTEMMTKTLEPVIQKQLNASTQILKISPILIHFKFTKLKRKFLPVKLVQHINLAQQYTLCDSIEIKPAKIEISGPRNKLDTMQFAYTEPLIITNLKDTILQSVRLKEIKDITYSTPSVAVTIKAEPYTEKTIEAPIIVTHVPPNHTLRVFPQVVSISFQLGLSLYDKINASSFILTADYNEIRDDNSLKKLSIEMEKQPSKIFNVKISPRQVDYLIEEKD